MKGTPMRDFLRALLAFLAIVVVPACGSGGDTTTIVQQTDAPSPGWIVMLTTGNSLVFVDPADPSVLRRIVPVIGLPAGVTLNAIAFRPTTGNLYAHGSDNSFYEVDLVTGGATEAAAGKPSLPGPPSTYTMSISPTSGVIRLLSNLLDNVRVSLTSTAVNFDTDLSAGVRHIAYSNNFEGAGTTTLFGIDVNNLVRIGGPDGTPSPNGGVVTVIGPHGVPIGNGPTGFAISPSGTAYIAYSNSSLNSELWTVDLTTGTSTLLGPTGINLLLGIAVVP
jgi:hypothetical protein